jgi:hypothetical protein
MNETDTFLKLNRISAKFLVEIILLINESYKNPCGSWSSPYILLYKSLKHLSLEAGYGKQAFEVMVKSEHVLGASISMTQLKW